MVRDDARRLDRCLLSLRDHVDEIVVLDTGSVDNTIEVARQHQARVHQIEWPNHFAKALNVLLGYVETAWTLRLDSDEWFSADQVPALANMRCEGSAAAFRLIRRDLAVNGKFGEIFVTRMWRTHERIRYEGAVHEAIAMEAFSEAWPGKEVIPTQTYFWHDGYTTDMAAKTQRNIDLLREEIKASPGRLDAEAMLATTLQSRNDPEGMHKLQDLMAKLVANDYVHPPAHVALAIAMYMSAMPESEIRSKQTSILLQRATEWFPRNSAILYYAGILAKERGDLEGALRYLLSLEERAKLKDYDRTTSLPPEFLEEKLWNALGFVAMRLGRSDIVERCNRQMIMLRQRQR